MIYIVNEGKVLIGEECNSLLTEAVDRVEKVTNDRVPEDFPKTIINIMNKIEENTGKKTGQGATGAALATYRIFPKNAKEKVLNNPPKFNYIIIVPLKRLFLNNKAESNRVDSLIEKSVTSLGYKKSGSIATGWNSFYKKGQNKTIYLLGWYKVNNNQMQIQNWCIEDNENNNKYVKSNHDNSLFTAVKNESANIFSSIEVL